MDAFIVTDTPRENSCADFWTLIEDQNIKTVITITSDTTAENNVHNAVDVLVEQPFICITMIIINRRSKFLNDIYMQVRANIAYTCRIFRKQLCKFSFNLHYGTFIFMRIIIFKNILSTFTFKNNTS